MPTTSPTLRPDPAKPDDSAAAFLAEFRRHNPCAESYAYAARCRFTSFGDVWARCDRGMWMLFLGAELGVTFDPRPLVVFACECAERALPLFEARYADPRPRAAIAGARSWLAGGSPAAVSLTTAAADAASGAASQAQSDAGYAAFAAAGASTAAAGATSASMGAIEAAAASAAAVGRIPLGDTQEWFAPALDGPRTFSGDSARAWLAEQRWQADRLRELIVVRAPVSPLGLDAGQPEPEKEDWDAD